MNLKIIFVGGKFARDNVNYHFFEKSRKSLKFGKVPLQKTLDGIISNFGIPDSRNVPRYGAL